MQVAKAKICEQVDQDVVNNLDTNNNLNTGFPIPNAPQLDFFTPNTHFFGCLAPITPFFYLFSILGTLSLRPLAFGVAPFSPSNRGLSSPFFILLLVFDYFFFPFLTLLHPVVSLTKILMPIPILLLLDFLLQCKLLELARYY